MFQRILAWLIRPEDDSNAQWRKRFVLLVFPGCALLGIWSGVSAMMRPGRTAWALSCACFMGAALTGFSVMYMFATRSLPQGFLEAVLLLSAIVTVLGDWGLTAEMRGARWWVITILICDCLLAMGGRRWVQWGCLHITAVWLCVNGLEDTMRLGLYDIEGWTEPPDEYMRSQTQCANYPCALGAEQAVLAALFYISCLYIDYMSKFTFAENLRREKEAMQASIHVAERVANLLAAYAIAAAQRVVDEDGALLPPELREALELLLRNLTRYRPFLPVSIFAADSEMDDGASSETRELVLPQLADPAVRGALECAVSQGAQTAQAELEELLAGCVRMCADAGDATSARRVLSCGWEAPPELEATLPPPEEDARASTADSLPAAEPLPNTLMARLAVSMSFASDTSSNGVLGETGRFSDGAGAPGTSMVPVPLWHAGYDPPPARDAAASLSSWHTPKGQVHWPRGLVSAVLADHSVCHPADSVSDYDSAPLYIYTVEMNNPVVWAAWQAHKGAWERITNADGDAGKHGFSRVQLGKEVLFSLGDRSPRSHGASELLGHSEGGLGVYGVQGRPVVLRYENAQGGHPEKSPLMDTIAWAPHPDRVLAPDCICSLTREGGPGPPPGVLEFITSRSCDVHIVRDRWESVPLGLSQLARLRDACMAQKNMQQPKAALCRQAVAAFAVPAEQLGGFGPDAAQLRSAIGAAYALKCADESPTPAHIAHACELGLLRWGGEWAVHAFTGEPRCVVPIPIEGERCRAERLWRCNEEHADQPYFLLNSAMRSQQNGSRDATLRLEPSLTTTLRARQPETPPAPQAALFEMYEMGKEWRTATTLTWSGSAWTGPGVDAAEGLLAMGAWGLPQYRALIWWLDHVLRSMPPAASRRRKGYRGLANVSLDRGAYSRGSVVVFGAFTSTSHDQGVATGFAGQDCRAAIFTMYSKTGRCISHWSRFAREKEMLLPPNTVHLVAEALTEEHAAILNRGKLQVYDLKELSLPEAVGHLAKEGAIRISKEHPGVLGQAERAAVRAAKGDWVGAARELLTRPLSSTPEQRFDRPVLPAPGIGVVALLFTSGAGQEVGAGIDAVAWSASFECTEQRARARGGRLLATHVGSITVLMPGSSAADAAHAAVGLAMELLEPDEDAMLLPDDFSRRATDDLPSRRATDLWLPTRRQTDDTSPRHHDQEDSLIPAPDDADSTQTSFSEPPQTPKSSWGDPRRSGLNSPRRIASSMFAVGRAFSTRSPSSVSPRQQRALVVHCGVAVGTVHSGFAGSAAQRVEIADGPAVRRARAMAAYSLRFGLDDAVADSACGAAASEAGRIVWTTDLAAFDTQREMRERLLCVGTRRSLVNHTAAAAVEDAWAAVLRAEGGAVSSRLVQDCIAAVPPRRAARAVAALREAAAAPATYCFEAEGFCSF